MRLARTRRALGPLEAPLADAYRWARGEAMRWLRPAVVVLATDGAHLDEAASLAGGLGRALGIWVTTSEDVTGPAAAGWFVVRLDPDTWSDEEARRRLRAIRQHLRVRKVIDLGSGPPP